MYILGISRHHDSAAAVLKDGQLVELAEVESLNCKTHFCEFPTEAILCCLNHACITLGDVDHVAYFWERWPEIVHGFKHFVRYAPGTFAVFKGGGDRSSSKGLLSTLASDGEQRNHDDYDVGGAFLLHIKRTFTLRQTLTNALGYTDPV